MWCRRRTDARAGLLGVFLGRKAGIQGGWSSSGIVVSCVEAFGCSELV